MKCKYCDSEMRLDDTDFNFKGNKDNYWVCDNCSATAFEKIRYGKSVSVQYQSSEDGMVKFSMCDWCTNEKYDDSYYGGSDFDKEFEIAAGSWTSLHMLHNSKTNKYGMYANGDGVAVVNINFCPNCGRKL